MFRTREWIAPTVATVAFLAALVAFVTALSRYLDSVKEWSRAELQSRAELTAAALAEPMRTLDFKAINATAEKLKADGLRLRIVSGREFCVSGDDSRQGFYDTKGDLGSADATGMWGVAHTGDFHVGVGRASSQVLKPFLNALAVVVFAGLVGVLALGAVFFVLYRQRVRIRELAKLEKFRRDFVADVSHEIRTPLTGILGAVDMLRDGGAENAEARGALLGMVEKESKRLAALVQQILDLARLEREGDVLSLSETDVVDLAREVAGKYGVELRGDAAAIVLCDAQLVSQALSNLVENAIRHSGSKEIAVVCGTDAKSVRIAVEDRGVGVPPEQVGRIFERFHRVDPARAAETGGAGLGLAIVRRIMRLHGGDVAYSPVRPHGSRFELSLPRGRQRSILTPRTGAEGPALSRSAVLVAFAVATLVAVQARGADEYDYYVSQTVGDDGYDGRTAERPFKTIDAALSAATNGQMVAVLPGTYSYPAFYSKADYREGAPRRIALFAVDADGGGETVIDASLAAEPNDARIVGCIREMWSLFDGFTFRGCRPKSSANRFSPYMYAYFRDCVFEHMDTTNQNAAAVWCWCVLDGCIVYDARVTAASGTPSMFQSCNVMDSLVRFSCGGGDLSLASGSCFDNCFLTGGPLCTLDSEPGQGDGFFNSTLLLGGVAFPNGKGDVGWYDYDGIWHTDKPAPLDGCLVGIDGYTNTYFVTESYVTNFATCAAAIDPVTLRIADASSMAYYYGYDALEDRLVMKANARPRTLTWNGGESGNLSSRSWDGGAGLHVTPYPGDTLVFPKGGRFVNDIGGLTLAGLSFEATNDVAIAGGPIEMVAGGVGVLAAGPGAVNIEAPLSFGASPTSTVCVGASAGVSLSIAAIAGPARALFSGPGTVLLGTAAMSTGEFVLSNAAEVVCLDGFSWGGERLFVVDGSTLVVDGAVALSERLDVSVRDRTGAAAAPSRLVLNSDVAFNYLTLDGSVRPGRKSYGSSRSGADIKDDTHFGGDCTAWVRHPERFSIVIR